MNRIKIVGGVVLIAASLSLSAACSLERHASSHATPEPTAVASKSAPTPLVNQTPADAAAQTPAQSPEDKMPRVGGAEALELFKAGKAVILDVRPVESYKMEHTKGSLSLPLTKIEQGDFKAMGEDGKDRELPRDKRIISYCT